MNEKNLSEWQKLYRNIHHQEHFKNCNAKTMSLIDRTMIEGK